MTYIKSTICAVLLVIGVSSTALAGNIAPRSGNIAPARTGNIAPARSGNIAPARTGNIAPARTGHGLVQPSSDTLGRSALSGAISSLFQLLLESGMLF
jgi:hypothetical protein